MPTVQGIFNSVQIPADQAKKSFASYITRLAPNGQSPLFGLTSMLKSETASNPFTTTFLFARLIRLKGELKSLKSSRSGWKMRIHVFV